MKERPIILAAWEVRAILDERKTRITRPIVPQPESGRTLIMAADGLWRYADRDAIDPQSTEWRCPFGVPGDVLIGKETWYCDDPLIVHNPLLDRIAEMRNDGTLVYRADDERPYEAEQPVWRPSIHMPRWASRIILRVESESVGRVQDISEEDAMAEGFVADMFSAAEECEIMWDARYAKRGLGYGTNCWVWSATFSRVADAATGADGRGYDVR